MTQDFIDSVQNWCDSLSEEIERVADMHKKIYIIALSRKMPRFFDWLRNNMQEESVGKLIRNLDSPWVELITEYAIPFVFSGTQTNANFNDDAGIIVDDAVIFGATANKVLMEWFAASGKKASYSALYRSEVGQLIDNYIANDLSRNAKPLPFGDIKSRLRRVSECILSSALPVDMEYPIIQVKGSYGRIKRHIEENAPADFHHYAVRSDMVENAKEAYTLMLEKSGLKDSFCDVSKARVFDKGDETAVEVLAPCPIPVDELGKHTFLCDTAYQKMWEKVASVVWSTQSSPKVGEVEDPYDKVALMGSLESRKLHTLNVWLNYLLSLSKFVENRKYILPEDVEFSIKASDISLILGSELADEIAEDLNTLIRKRETTSISYQQRVALPIYVNPIELRDDYMKRLAEDMTPNQTVKTNLDQIYGVSYFAGPLYEKVSDKSVMGHHIIGESYESLKIQLNRYHYLEDDSEIDKEINMWIDQRIDECRISPKYEEVTGSDQKKYFRRFYLSGSNSI